MDTDPAQEKQGIHVHHEGAIERGDISHNHEPLRLRRLSDVAARGRFLCGRAVALV